MTRYAKRRDKNEAEIADALRKAGFTVLNFGSAGHDIPDLLAVKPLWDGRKWACWVEVKSKDGKLSEGQRAFRDIFQPRNEWYEGRDPAATVNTLQAMYLEAQTLHREP